MLWGKDFRLSTTEYCQLIPFFEKIITIKQQLFVDKFITLRRMDKRLAVVWFRRDLRLHDNEVLVDASRHSDYILPVYVFDPREWEGSLPQTGLSRTDSHRAQFILESVIDLKQNLRDKGSDLLILQGRTEEVMTELMLKVHAYALFCNREPTRDELAVQNALEERLWPHGREIYYSRGKMLYYTSDLPYPITHTPDTFKAFRKETERITSVRQPLPMLEDFKWYEGLNADMGIIPSLKALGIEEAPDKLSPEFKGGETAGLKSLTYFLKNTIHQFKLKKDRLSGTSRLSPWLAQGCISPKTVYWAVKEYENTHGADKNTYGIIYELLWRDFYRLLGKKYGEAIFSQTGPGNQIVDQKIDLQIFQEWVHGMTGTPLIDANMRNLADTGFISKQGRLAVASYLVHDLKLDWRLGAEYFAHIMIDYDITSNWGNWNTIAGVGTDSKEDTYVNPLKLAKRLDPQGRYVKRWCPELAKLPEEFIHQPDQAQPDVLQSYGVELGVNYPHPLIASNYWILMEVN